MTQGLMGFGQSCRQSLYAHPCRGALTSPSRSGGLLPVTSPVIRDGGFPAWKRTPEHWPGSRRGVRTRPEHGPHEAACLLDSDSRTCVVIPPSGPMLPALGVPS